MRVAITGASGFVGSHVVPHLRKAGHDVVGQARTVEGVQRLRGMGAEAQQGDVARPATLASLVEGADAVVHLVAIIRERGEQTFEKVNVRGTANVLDAARSAGATRFIHQGALGAVDDARYPYLQSKWKGEEEARNSGLAWTVLRPSMLFGEGDHVFTLFAEMARQPVVPVIGAGDMKLQPMWVGDLARIVQRCLEDDATQQRTYDLGGPEHVRYEDMVKAALQASGRRKPLLHVPEGLMKVAVSAMAMVQRDPPITQGELAILLKGDNVTELDSVQRAFGFAPRRLRDGLDYLRRA